MSTEIRQLFEAFIFLAHTLYQPCEEFTFCELQIYKSFLE